MQQQIQPSLHCAPTGISLHCEEEIKTHMAQMFDKRITKTQPLFNKIYLRRDGCHARFPWACAVSNSWQSGCSARGSDLGNPCHSSILVAQATRLWALVRTNVCVMRLLREVLRGKSIVTRFVSRRERNDLLTKS